MIHAMFYDKSIPIDLYHVKTRKILMFSNIIASVSNLIVAAIESVIKGQLCLNHFDIGGLLVTLYRIVTDTKFISEVKAEVVNKEFFKLVQGSEYNFNIPL